MKTVNYKTDFVFVDNRDYVHSSTILSVLSKIVNEFCSTQDNTITLGNLKLRSEVKKNGTIHIANLIEDFIGLSDIKFEFHFKCNDIQYFAYFVEDVNSQIIKIINSQYHMIDYDSYNSLNGMCLFNTSKFNESIYADIVEFNKKIHLSHYPKKNTSKILNVSMKNVPFWNNFNNLDFIDMTCKNLFVRENHDGIMTLNKITLTGKMNSISLEISFFLPL